MAVALAALALAGCEADFETTGTGYARVVRTSPCEITVVFWSSSSSPAFRARIVSPGCAAAIPGDHDPRMAATRGRTP